jgi:uncharacterized SAM-binding protein YcdF (DUF218 family)
MPSRPLFVALVVLVALILLSVPLFITYDDDPAVRADAVIVLSGSKKRLPVALELMRRGVAPTLVVSYGLERRNPAAVRVCTTKQPFAVACPKPEPFSTRGEARLIARLAAERGWRSVVVVTSRFHLRRARMLIERCYGGRLAMVGAPIEARRLPVAVGLEWVKLARAEVIRSC